MLCGIGKILLIVQIIFWSIQSIGAPNLFLKNLSKKIDKRPGLVVRVCNKRLTFEVSKTIGKSSSQLQLERRLNSNRALFLSQLIEFCSKKAMPKASKKDRLIYREILLNFASGIIPKNFNGYESAFSNAIESVYSERDSLIELANKKLLRSLEILPNEANLEILYFGYLANLIEKIIPYGNLNSSKNFINLIKQKKGISNLIKYELEATTARLLFLHGKFTESKSLYESVILSEKNVKGISSLIARIEYASVLRSLGRYKESEKFMLSAESELQSKGHNAFWGWFFLEKSQLDFAVNQNFKSANKLLKKSEDFYKKANRGRNFYFTHLKRAEFLRKVGKLQNSKNELKKASGFLKEYQHSPLYLFEYLYQSALTDFYLRDIDALRNIVNQIEGTMRLTNETQKYRVLLAPLLAHLKKIRNF
jgi:tetratricopeptide (TPR) repeat protein